MSIIYLLTSIAVVIYLKDSLNLFFKLKIWLGYPPTEMVKPFDCYFCLIGWATILTFLFTFDFYTLPVGYLIAKQWN